jgi:hypothetical protein
VVASACTASNSSSVVQMHSARSTRARFMASQLRHQLGRAQWWQWESVNMTNGTFRSAVATVRMR